ncbi:ribosomal protein s16 domain-containing protein [Ditylenchus destructor]|uniref:Small ribosomal subunit protein bS16m n=1 Tax=Ditylenchus destructor TaxID=166010 RepID=A0AAD4RD88_9BILA|nr:ribosomal protein s16 domain-containing protein [Ditylenchus destructor]
MRSFGRILVNPRIYGEPSIGLARVGCKNRPVFHIAVFPDKALGRRWSGNIVEQIGSFDPIPNNKNEKLVALDIHRLKYWIGERNARVGVTVLELLGLAGLLPIHPKTFIRAQNSRIVLEKQKQQLLARLERLKQETETKETEEGTENLKTMDEQNTTV